MASLASTDDDRVKTDVPVAENAASDSSAHEDAAKARSKAGHQFLEDFGFSFDVPFSVEDIQQSVDDYLCGKGVFDTEVDDAA